MIKKIFIISFIICKFTLSSVAAEKISNIEIQGNDRISDNTIKLFSDAKINDEIDNSRLNEILNNLYQTDFLRIFL